MRGDGFSLLGGFDDEREKKPTLDELLEELNEQRVDVDWKSNDAQCDPDAPLQDVDWGPDVGLEDIGSGDVPDEK